MPSPSDVSKVIDQLYRELYGKMVSSVVSYFTLKNLAIAEDIVHDTFESAMLHWKSEVPQNPTNWLFRVCRNKMINHLQRSSSRVVSEKKIMLDAENMISEDLFDPSNIKDSQLRLLFACCHPDVSPRSQLLFILKNICGLRVNEIARAVAMNEEAVTKSLSRSRKVLAESFHRSEKASGLHEERREIVHIAIYLMFNEGYSATQGDEAIRYELCMEAMRLMKALLECHQIVNDDTYAIMALMCFHTARTAARTGLKGEIIELEMQDRSKWDPELINLGTKYLGMVSRDQKATRFILEAGIAFTHCAAPSFEQTNWPVILGLYEKLRLINPSPFTELNCCIAKFYVHGSREAIDFLETSKYLNWLRSYYLYYAVLGKIYATTGKRKLARENYEKALSLTTQRAEQEFLQQKVTLYSVSDVD